MAFRVAGVPILLIAACLCGASSERNPGISVRMSEEVFNLVLDKVKPIIQAEIIATKIPFIAYHISHINTDLQLKNLALRPDTIRFDPRTALAPVSKAGGLGSLLSVHMAGVGSYYTKARWWPHITSHGSLQFGFNPMNVFLDMTMSPGADGLWDFKLTQLGVNANFYVDFHGGILSVVDIGQVEAYINEKASAAVSKGVREKVAEAIAKLTPTMRKYLPYLHFPKKCVKAGLPPICKDFALNLSLTSGGVWKDSCYAEVQLDGYVVYKNKGFTPASSAPFPIIPAPCGDRHFSMLVSGVTFASAVNAVLASGVVNVNTRTGKFCDDPMIALFLPKLGMTFGHLPLYANITLVDSKFSLKSGRAAVTIDTTFQVLADTTPHKTSDRIFKEALTVDISVTIALAAWIKPYKTPMGVFNMLYLNFTSASCDSANITRSSVGSVPDAAIQSLVEIVMLKSIQNADSVLSLGALILPERVKNIPIINPEIVIGDDHIKMAFDVSPGRKESEDVNESEASEKGLSGEATLANFDIDQLSVVVDSVAQSFSDKLMESQEFFMNYVSKTFLTEV